MSTIQWPPKFLSGQPSLFKQGEISWMYLKNVPGRDGFIDLNRNFDAVTDPDPITWNANSAAVAYALLQSPGRL